MLFTPDSTRDFTFKVTSSLVNDLGRYESTITSCNLDSSSPDISITTLETLRFC
jgi:hypothetical protein